MWKVGKKRNILLVKVVRDIKEKKLNIIVLCLSLNLYILEDGTEAISLI